MRLSTCLPLLLSLGLPLHAQFADNSQLTLEDIVAFTEGPAWHPSGNVYFTHIANNCTPTYPGP
ncbi:MAG: hypothetical protein VCA37_05620 [Roseibacillus sp.]